MLKKIVLGLLVSSLLLAIWSTSFAAGLSLEKINKLQTSLNQWRKHYQIPGASLTVISPSDSKPINFTSGTKKINDKEKITPKTLFQICSVTKVYTAVLIFQLEAEGKLSISQALDHWLPQYKQWKNVTIKQLLNMHSGIPSFSDDKKFNQIAKGNPTRYWTTAETINFVKNKPMLFKPGTNWNYSDINYVLLGLIIEKASGKSYTQMLQQNIIKPLHLKHTFYVPYAYTPTTLRKMATGYSQDNKDVMNFNMSQAGAAGAIIATTQDTAVFFHALFSGHLLKPKQLNEMLVPYATTSGKQMAANPKMLEAWAVGIAQFWMPKEGLMWTKAGGFMGFFSQACYSEKSHVVIILSSNKWVPKDFGNVPRKFIPKLYSIIGSN